MHTRLTTTLFLFFACCFLQASADESTKQGNPKSVKPAPSKADIQQAKLAAAKHAELRGKATKNVETLLAKLELTSSQQAKVKALSSKQQWDATVSAFKTARENEIHDHAHKLAAKTIPGMMQKFMPGYMMGKISAQRRKQRKRGPPSGAEIAKIRKDAQSKMQPAMRKTVMPALDKLTKARLTEMLVDEKTLTRLLADRIIKSAVLGKDGTKEFASALEKAGYSASLTAGQDGLLNDRTVKMLKSIDLKKVAKTAGL
jgi:hypothetical protein